MRTAKVKEDGMKPPIKGQTITMSTADRSHLTETTERISCRWWDGAGVDINVDVARRGKFTTVRRLNTDTADTGNIGLPRRTLAARDVSDAHLFNQRPILPLYTHASCK